MSVAPFIRIRGLKKSFGRQIVLSHVDLDLPCANNMVLLGVSGSGKTVLMKCVLGLIAPDAGSIEVDGRETVGISPRERSVLDGLAEGLAYKQIADQLGVSIHTVRNYIRRIYEKLHVCTRTEAVAKFLRK